MNINTFNALYVIGAALCLLGIVFTLVSTYPDIISGVVLVLFIFASLYFVRTAIDCVKVTIDFIKNDR
jgi:hypothetical protein